MVARRARREASLAAGRGEVGSREGGGEAAGRGGGRGGARRGTAERARAGGGGARRGGRTAAPTIAPPGRRSSGRRERGARAARSDEEVNQVNLTSKYVRASELRVGVVACGCISVVQ